MNAIAEKARAASMRFEAKKHGLSQQQSGEWTLTLKVHANDVPTGLLTAAMGTRYVVAIVEVNDQEEPVEQKPASNPHRLSQQAAMLCGDTSFQNFLSQYSERIWGASLNESENRTDRAAWCVRALCNVQSRAVFDTNKDAASRWRDLYGEFEAWKLTT